MTADLSDYCATPEERECANQAMARLVDDALATRSESRRDHQQLHIERHGEALHLVADGALLGRVERWPHGTEAGDRSASVSGGFVAAIRSEKVQRLSASAPRAATRETPRLTIPRYRS